MRTVTTDAADSPVPAHDHGVPREHGLMDQGIGEAGVQVHHHLGDAAFRRRNARLIRGEPELLTKGRSHAVAVEDFAFDFGGLQGFVAYQLDPEHVLVMPADVLESPDELARLQEELTLERIQNRCVVGKFRPLRLLPVPCHEL